MLNEGFFIMDFEELRDKLDSKLKAITYKLDYRYSAFGKDDLYQEALLYLWRLYDKDILNDKTDGYILKGCFLHLKNYIRKMYKAIDKNSISIYEDNINNKGISFENILTKYPDVNKPERIKSLIVADNLKNILNPREERVFSLRAKGFTVREISRELGVSHVMIVKINKRARNKCLAFFEKKL